MQQMMNSIPKVETTKIVTESFSNKHLTIINRTSEMKDLGKFGCDEDTFLSKWPIIHHFSILSEFHSFDERGKSRAA
jgi:hypothetical protein